jgi:hypothetical protein
MKFLAVHWVSLVTRRECHADWWWVRTEPPLPHIEAAGSLLFYWLFTAKSSVPRIAVTWTCDWLDWFSLIIIKIVISNSLLHHHPKKE